MTTEDPYKIERNLSVSQSTEVSQVPEQEVVQADTQAESTTPLIDRVTKRVETDLDPVEIQALIDEATNAIVARYGPTASSGSVTERFDGYTKRLVVSRQIDTAQPIVITEYVSEYGWGETPYILTAYDYRIWPDKYVIERLTSGPNAWPRWVAQVEVTYVPLSDDVQREEVIIKLVMLSVQYDAVSTHTIGDTAANNLDYKTERENLIASLAPRGSLFMA